MSAAADAERLDARAALTERLDARAALTERLDARFRDPALLELALTHRSYAYEHEMTATNERLELLGDSVLNFAITTIIYRRFASYPEGDLAKLRSSLVSAPALSAIAEELDVGSAVLLGRGEELTGGREKMSILADTMEALIGAVFVDRGVREATRIVRRLFRDRLRAAVGADVPRDPKTALQETVTQRHGVLPRYETAGDGPDHAKTFNARVFVCGTMYGEGVGGSKKEAEQAAAALALERLSGEGSDVITDGADA